jgi:hypothetical protein
MIVVSAAIGAVTPSRVVTDRKRSDALLRAARNHLLTLDEGNARACERDDHS